MASGKGNGRQVIFDIGGVLIDFSVSRLVRRIVERTGVPLEAADAVLRSDPVRRVESGQIDSRAFFDQTIKPLLPQWSYDDWVAAWMENYSINRPGYDLFLELRDRGVPVSMLSNLAEYNKEALERKFPDFFGPSRANVFSYEVGCMKPDARIYRAACARLGAAPEQCVFLDDVPENVAGAAQVGMRALLFSNAAAAALRAALGLDGQAPGREAVS
jgi:FMN phosphatase YigB (HAD superfamily)